MHVEFYKHNIGEEEKKKVLECLDGIFLTTGVYVSDFEKFFAQYLDLKYAVGLNSCTAALHLSLLSLNVGPGDEVITTPMTFIATVTAIMHTGAKPVFVDVEPDSALIDPTRIEAAITDRTRVILPVHLYGQMCDMKKIRSIADKYDLKIVEDSAHCIEGERDGVRPGQLGDVACFSFYATKNITSGEGGAIATDSREIAERVRILRLHGMSKEAADRYTREYHHWDMLECGWKYNMDNIQAALLLPQLRKIEENWRRREEIYNTYQLKIEHMEQVEYPKIPQHTKGGYHLFTIWVKKDKRDDILKALGSYDIGATVNYRAIHLLSYLKNKYKFKPGDFPVAEEIGNRTISLPFYAKLNSTELEYVCESLQEIVEKFR